MQINLELKGLRWVLRNEVRTSDESEALNAGEVGVLDGHDASLGKQLLWIVVDQLSVKEKKKKKLKTGNRKEDQTT